MKNRTGSDIDIGTARFESKRNIGISPIRSDGSIRSINTDINATAAERFAAEEMGCQFNDKITTFGDGGFDYIFPLTVEVVWLGIHKESNKARTDGHLIVNPYERHRWADIYVVVSGDINNGFKIVGWTTHKRLASKPLKDFGYGNKYAMHTNELEPLNRLLGLKEY